ncbi:hypothetical protein DL98DRAFT_540368 [Cadophora sp. DSE1049]|nr:hypothetical protein DL98DRAFT_540368 [Cadophora sp. DSE1049]
MILVIDDSSCDSSCDSYQSTEIAYIISQVLAGIRFIWSRNLNHQLISVRNILISQKGNVKIGEEALATSKTLELILRTDPTIRPTRKDQTSGDLNSLGAVMLQLIRETKGLLSLLDPGRWSAEAIDFVEATSWASPDELSDHIFVTDANEPKTLTALCFLTIQAGEAPKLVISLFNKTSEACNIQSDNPLGISYRIQNDVHRV